MYKVEKYKYVSESTERFTNDEIYFLRVSKDGVQIFLSTNDERCELRVRADKISMSDNFNKNFLEENFEYVGFEMHKNYKDYKKNRKKKV